MIFASLSTTAPQALTFSNWFCPKTLVWCGFFPNCFHYALWVIASVSKDLYFSTLKSVTSYQSAKAHMELSNNRVCLNVLKHLLGQIDGNILLKMQDHLFSAFRRKKMSCEFETIKGKMFYSCWKVQLILSYEYTSNPCKGPAAHTW